MRKLRRFIWYLAGRLLLITVLLGLFTVTFYYAMNASNIYIVLKDGMAKRAQVIMMGESPSDLTKFFRAATCSGMKTCCWPLMGVAPIAITPYAASTTGWK